MSKTRMGKRVASLLLSLVMMLSLLPTTVYAEGENTGDTTDEIVGQATTSGANTENTGEPGSTGEGDAVIGDAADSALTTQSGDTEMSVTYAAGETETVVAKIDAKEYATLADAIAAAEAGDTIQVLADATLGADLTKDNITIEGVVIDGVKPTIIENHWFKASNVTIKNLKLVRKDRLGIQSCNDVTFENCEITRYESYTGGELVDIKDGTSDVFFKDCQITNLGICKKWALVCTRENAENVVFTNCTLDNTGMTSCIYARGKDLTLTGCTLKNADFGIYCDGFNGTLTVDNCTFTNLLTNVGHSDTTPAAAFEFKNSELAGYFGFVEDSKVSFADCKFTKASKLDGTYNSDWNQVFTCCDVAFENCTFTEDYLGMVYVSVNTHEKVIVMNGCDIVDTDGQTVEGKTAADLASTNMTTGANPSGVLAIDAETNDAGEYIGGTFVGSVENINNVLADGVQLNNDGTVTPATTTAVAKIGEQSYDTLQAAFDAAANGATITLLANTTEDVEISKNITLDLGGKTLTNTNTNTGKATISVKGGTVTVKNGTVIGGTSYYNIEVTKGSNANLTLENVTATAGNNGSSMIDNWGTLTIESGTYEGGLNVVKSEEGSKLTINGGTFTLDYAPSSGYTATILVYGDTTINGGEFIQTAKPKWGYPQVVMTGVVEGYEAITKVTGGTFTNQKSGDNIFHGLGKATSANFKVSGGTFNKSISEGYCADGFIPTKNADGTYGVKEGQYVAQIGDKKYETLADAIRLAANGKTVTLLCNVTENVTIAANKNLTLDLNGFTLNGGTSDGKPALLNKGTVTIKDSSANQNGKICREDNGAKGYYVIDNQGTMTIESGHIYNSTGNMPEGSSLIRNAGLKASAILTIKGGDIRQDGFIAIKNDDHGILYISDGTITTTGDTSTNTASAVQNWATAEITGGTINGAIWTSVWSNDLPASVTTIKDATVTGKIIVEPYTSDITTVPTLNIEGGTYTNTSWDVRGNGVVAVSGGTFKAAVPAKYCAEGFIPKDNGDGTYGVKAGAYVAEVNGVGYETLQEAINAAANGATVTLLADCESDRINLEDKSITVDLNGKTLTSTAAYGVMFCAKNGNTITVNGTTEGSRLVGTLMVTAETDGHIVINGGIYESAKYCPIYINGAVSSDSSTLTVKDATITALSGDSDQDNGVAVYLAGYSTSTFTKTTITAPVTGLEIRAGKLTLTDCTVTGGSGEVVTNANGNGTTVTNAAVAISQHTTKKDIDVTITGGTYTAKAAVYQTNVQGTGSENVKVSITSGTFEGAVSAETNNTVAVSGGSFTSAVPENCCAEGFVPTQNDDGTYGVREANYVAEVSGTKYESLAEAIEAASRNATVKMLADTRENVTIANDLTLDLNGHTLNGGTEKGKPALTVKASVNVMTRVTVKDSSEAQTGIIMREDTAENSGVSSHYVIDIQGKCVLIFESGNVKNNSGNKEGKGASLVRVGDDSNMEVTPFLTITGGTFTQNNFIAIKVDRGILNLSGGEVNSANSYAVENWCNANIKDGIVNGTVSTWVYSKGAATSKLTIIGGTVKGDVASVNYDSAADKQARVFIEGGTVTGTLGTYTYNNGLVATNETSKATIKVSGGTFNNAVETRYCDEGYTPVQISDGKYGVQQQQQVLAKIGDTAYYTMYEAFRAVQANETIVMQRDYTTGVEQYSGSKSFTIDLNDKTWTYTGTNTNHAAFEINHSDVTLTVKNGTVVSNSMVGLIPSAIGMDGPIAYDNAGLVFEGVTMTANGYSGIETNGSNTSDTVTLKNSTLNVPDGFGIYFPSSGTLTIDNSTITAKTMGVQVCAGSLSINAGSAITVTGDAVPKTENDGAIQDGAAISIVNRAGYKGLGDVTVTGGTFTAKTGNAAIKAYNWDNNTESAFTANDKINVSGGTFSSAVPEGLCAEGYVPKDNGDGNYTVAKYVAEYNGTKYTSLQEAIDAASHRSSGQTEVTLLCNVTIKETVTFAKEFSAGSVLLNLGGYTLTGEGCRALQINRGSLYLENGTVTSTGIVDSSSVIRIGSNEATYNGATPMLHMQKDAKVVAPESYGVTIFGSATRGEKLKVMSNAEIIATGPSPAISGNGGANYNTDDRTSGWKAEEIIIGENAVISAANNYAIYHPECGTLNIQGGTITGTGGIQMCSGTLKISNSPKITANGSADYDYTGDAGVVYDAAAISVINRGYPQGPATATIKGTPTVTAANGEVIHAFTWSNSNKTDGKWAEAGDYINVSGGTYNKQFNEAYLAADCTLVTNSEGGYTVEQKKVAEYNGTQYTSLAQAILDANKAGGTVKLLDNVTLTRGLGIGGTAKVTLDLNKKTLTLDGAQLYTQGSATVTINNGTIKRTDEPTSGSASNFAIQVMSGSSLTLGAGTGSTYKVTLESTYGIYNVGGTLNVRYATITTDGWSIAVSDSASKTGEVYIGRGMGSNTKTVITSESGNVLGTMVGSKPNVTINYGTLTSNGTAWDAGVVYWASEGTLTITGGTFTASSAEGSAAAAVHQKNGTVKISGTTAKLLGSNALVVKPGEGSTGTMVTELSGGTYSTRPEDSWVVDGKEIHETDKGYKVEDEYVVEVTHANGTVTSYDAWSKLAAVWNEHGATIKLLKDTTTAELVATNGDITIDFNGKTLTVTKETSSSDYAAAIVVQLGGKLTLEDSSEAANGGMTATNVYGVEVITGSSVTVTSGSYSCDTSVVQVDDGTAYIKGGTFKTEAADKSYLLNCIDKEFAAGNAKMEVTGGTFYGFDPSANPEGEGTSYVAEGYVSELTPSGAYEVVEAVYVAAIGDKQYTSLANAFAAANEGDTVKLIANFTTDATKTEAADRLIVKKSITLDLNGYTMTIPAELEQTNNWAAFYINDGTLTVKDSSEGGSGKMQSGDANTLGTYLFHLNGGNLVIESGNYFAGCTVANVQKGTATVNGGSFAVYVDEGEDSRYLLNCIDASYKAGTAHIIVNGGTFAGYDPRNNAAEGKGTSFVPVGVGVSVDENGNFVAKDNMIAQITKADGSSVKAYKVLAEAIGAATDGQIVELLNAIETSSTIEANMATGVTLDLNGFLINGETIPENTADKGVLKLTIGDESTTKGTVRINGSAKVIRGKLPLVFDSVNRAAEIRIVLDKNMRLETTITDQPANKVRLLQAPMYLDDYEGMGQDHYQIGGVFYTSGDTDRRVYESLQYVIKHLYSATLLHSYETNETLQIPDVENQQISLHLSTATYTYTGTGNMIEVPAGAVFSVSGSGELNAPHANSVIRMTGGNNIAGATIVSLGSNTLTGGKYGVFAEDMGWNSDETRQDKLELQNTTITANDMGVYFSSNGAKGETEGNGSLRIQGSTIQAKTGVQVSADSKLYIDSSITATGNGEGAIGNGPILDGAAVSIIKRGETAVASRSISGGTFISANGVDAVQTYDATGTDKADWTPETGFITGGRFSTDVKGYCAIGYQCNDPAGTETMYTVTKMEKISMTRKLTLAHDLIVTYTAKVPDGYTAPYAAFSFENSNSNAWEDTQVAGTVLKTEEGFTYYTFAFTGINPQRMTNTLKTKIYATNSSEQVVALTGEMEDSVAKYCATVIEKYNTAGTWTELISNLVAYGAASQQYMRYNLRNLVSSYSGLENLTTTDYSGKPGDIIAPTSRKNSVDGGVTISSASVVLTSSFAVRLYFTLDAGTDLNTVKFTATVGGKTTEFTKYDSDGSERYYFDYVGLNAQQLDSEITFASFVGAKADDTVGYSVNTYLATYIDSHKDDADLNEMHLVKALFNYGWTCKNFGK